MYKYLNDVGISHAILFFWLSVKLYYGCFKISLKAATFLFNLGCVWKILFGLSYDILTTSPLPPYYFHPSKPHHPHPPPHQKITIISKNPKTLFPITQP